MAKPSAFGGVSLDVNAGRQALAEEEPIKVRPDPEDPFRILILGNFSGRAKGTGKPIEVDRDNLDEVVRSLRVEAELKLGNNSVYRLAFETMDDFEPDRIVERCELFRRLEDVAAPQRTIAEKKPDRRERQIDVAKFTSGSLLDAILGEEEAKGEADVSAKRSEDELQAMINRAIEPFLERGPSAGERQQAADRERRMGLLLRAILHDARFQAIEAAWRSVEFLVRQLETDERLKLYLFDISKDKLAADLLQDPDFRSSNTYRVIVEDSVRTPGADLWALLVGNYSFDRNVARDVELLASLGLLARATRAPFLAECLPSANEDVSVSEAWQALRESSYASWLGLALPRFLLRLPYGKNTVPMEKFAFEEMPGRPEHDNYLWGNPAFAGAYLLGLSFSEVGWQFRPGLHLEISGLPLHVFHADGATRTQPCAEILLTETDCNELLDEGLMPLASIKDRDSVRLIRFQSIADPEAGLPGRWG